MSRRYHNYIPDDVWETRKQEARALSWAGATMDEIAQFFGVSVASLYRWNVPCPGFTDSCSELNTQHDRRVENKLLKMAEEGNVSAIQFYLKNRRAAHWRDRRELDLGGDVTVNHVRDERSVAMAMFNAMRVLDAPNVIEGTVNGPEELQPEPAEVADGGRADPEADHHDAGAAEPAHQSTGRKRRTLAPPEDDFVGV